MDGIYDPPIDLEQVHLKRLQIFGISNARQPVQDRFETTRGFVRDVLPAFEDGRLRPVVDRVFAFDELPVARAHMDSSARVGKVIVKMPD
jgi:NADPH:quinone reductase-like Zn-dependent oxidoreductase